MKTLITLIVMSALLFAGCSVDNYDEPELVIEGAVYDQATMGDAEPALITTQAPNGIKIRMYESGYTQPIDFWCSASGRFRNERVFAGEYNITVEGPFIVEESDAVIVSVHTDKKINFYVEPYLRIQADAVKNGSNVDVKFTITRSDQWPESLVQYAVLYSWTEGVNYNSFSSRQLFDVSDDSSILGEEQTFTISDIDWNRPVFVRVAAITSGTDQYNYSEVIEVKE